MEKIDDYAYLLLFSWRLLVSLPYPLYWSPKRLLNYLLDLFLPLLRSLTSYLPLPL